MTNAKEIIATTYIEGRTEPVGPLHAQAILAALTVAGFRIVGPGEDQTPEPDTAMAELLEEATTALAAKDAELAAEHAALRLAADRADRAEAQLAETRKALAALDRMSRGVDWCDQDEQARRWDAARRALTGGQEDG